MLFVLHFTALLHAQLYVLQCRHLCKLPHCLLYLTTQLSVNCTDFLHHFTALFTSLHSPMYFTILLSVLNFTSFCTLKHCFPYFTEHHYVLYCTGFCTSPHNTLYVYAELYVHHCAARIYILHNNT